MKRFERITIKDYFGKDKPCVMLCCYEENVYTHKDYMFAAICFTPDQMNQLIHKWDFDKAMTWDEWWEYKVKNGMRETL